MAYTVHEVDQITICLLAHSLNIFTVQEQTTKISSQRNDRLYYVTSCIKNEEMKNARRCLYTFLSGVINQGIKLLCTGTSMSGVINQSIKLLCTGTSNMSTRLLYYDILYFGARLSYNGAIGAKTNR